MQPWISTAGRRLRRGLFTIALLAAPFLAQPASAQHTSTECPAQTATVTSGGTVSIDITDCAYDLGFAYFGGIDGGSYGPPRWPLHGTATTRRQDNGPGIADDQWMLDYSHNGSTGIGGTDVFESVDASFTGDGDIQFTITITSSASSFTTLPAVLPTMTVGVPFSQALSSTGGTGPYSYALQSGALPPGLTLSSTGGLSGTPTQRGTYNFMARVTDSLGATGDKSYAGTLGQPTLVMSPNLVVIPRGQSVSRTLSTTGGVAPYSYMVETFPSNMPAGLSLSSAGVITGSTNDAAGDIVMTLRVTDSSTGPGQWFEAEPLTIRLTNNQVPTANAGTDQTVASAASVTLNGTGSTDPESTPLTYTWTQTGGPVVTLSSTTAAQPTFTAPTVAWNASAQVLTFSLTVSDGVNTSTADTVQVTVNPAVNQRPVASAGADQTVASGAGVTLNGSGSSDPEGQTLAYYWTQTGGPMAILANLGTASPSFTAPTVAFGSPPAVLTFSLSVHDGVQSSLVADTVQITVNPQNQAPAANAGSDQTVASAASVTLDGTGSTDPENAALTYTWSQIAGPVVALSSTTAASPGFTAPTVPWNASAQVLTFSLTVNDGSLTSTADTVQITVSPTPNQRPVASAGADQTVASGAGVTLNGSGSSDPEGQTLAYYWTQTGGPAVTLANSASPTFIAPTVAFGNPPAVLTFSLIVNDGVQDSQAADTVQITVNPQNQAPTANAGADQTVASAASVTLSALGSTDPESQTLSVAWTQTGGPAVTLSSVTAAQPTFTAPTVAWNASAQVLTFSLTVSDGANTSTADTVEITVNPAANQVPLANAGADQTVASAAGVTLDGSGSSDPEGQPMAYVWTQTAGPAVTLTSTTAASPTFTAPTVAWNASATVLTFSLTVDDGVNTSTADTVQITVNPEPNQLPTANAGADQTVGSAAGVTLDGSGSTDPEGQPLAYSWTQTGGPAVTLSSTTAASPTFTAPTVAWNASAVVLTFSLTVDDGVNTSIADSVQITVNPAANQLPTANAGPDQTVASAAGVTLDGSGSNDPEGQGMTYAWSQTGGPAATLSSTTVMNPGFTAPTLGWNAPDVQFTFQLIVNDGVQDSAADTVTITVSAPVDTSHPTVTLSGMPGSVMPGDPVAITVTFSEAVSGLAVGDFTVANGTVTGLTGSGASYTLSLTAGGGGVLSVLLPADSAEDVALNGNLASNTLTAAAGIIEETETAIAEYLARRANALVGAQPNLIRLLNPGGPAQISVSSKGFSFATNGTQSVWTSLSGQWGESGDTDTRYVLGAVGTHAWLNDRTILGLMLEFDQMVQDDPTRRIEGTGWLIGPYVAGQIQDQPLYYEGRLLWGQSDNEIAPTGQPVTSFGSERFLAQIKLQGEFALGQAIATPFVDASYTSDKQEAYTDGLGNPISAQEVRQSQIALGIDLRQAFPVNGGVLTPTAGISAVYSDTSGAGTVALAEPEHDGWRGRVRAGVTYSRGLSRFEAAAFFDGLGTGNYRDYGLSLGFETQF